MSKDYQEQAHLEDVADKQFIGEIFKIAFGLGASNRGFSREEVIERLRHYAHLARGVIMAEATEETEQ